jgi:uncharacterized protein YoxC
MSENKSKNNLNTVKLDSVGAEDIVKVLESIVANNHETMLAFNEAMGKRENLSIRIAKRTTQILRFGIISILMISGLMFFLIQSLSKHIDTMANNITDISTTMGSMDQSFTLVTQQLARIDATMTGLNQQITVMSEDIHTVPQMSQTMHELKKSVDVMGLSMSSMTGDMRVLNHSTAGINQQFSTLIQQVGRMTSDVNQMSRPMKFFPFPD